MFFSRLSRLISPADVGAGFEAGPRGAGFETGPRAAGRPGLCVGFLGARGGVGCTMLAAEFAAYAARGGARTAAVDADRGRGNLHHRLDVPLSRDTFTLGDVAPVLEEIDESLLERVLSPSRSGAMLLPRDPGVAPRPGAVEHLPVRVLKALSGSFDVVVVDTGAVPAGLELCLSGGFDAVALVAVPELSPVASARAAIGPLKSGNAKSLALLLNRSLGRGDSISAADVRSYVGERPALLLPEDTAACRRAADEGALLFEHKSALGRALRRMPGVLLPPGGIPGLDRRDPRR